MRRMIAFKHFNFKCRYVEVICQIKIYWQAEKERFSDYKANGSFVLFVVVSAELETLPVLSR